MAFLSSNESLSKDDVSDVECFDSLWPFASKILGDDHHQKTRRARLNRREVALSLSPSKSVSRGRSGVMGHDDVLLPVVTGEDVRLPLTQKHGAFNEPRHSKTVRRSTSAPSSRRRTGVGVR
jgi:hypothetical protein